jgi:hypothetical protein
MARPLATGGRALRFVRALGFGVEVPLSWHVSIGAEATHHINLGERFSSDTTNGTDGGDISTFDAVLRFRP